MGPYYDKQRRFSMVTSSHPLIISSRRSSASFESCEDFSTIAETHFSTGSPLVMFLERFLTIRGGFGGFKDGQSKKSVFFTKCPGPHRKLLPARKCGPNVHSLELQSNASNNGSKREILQNLLYSHIIRPVSPRYDPQVFLGLWGSRHSVPI